MSGPEPTWPSVQPRARPRRRSSAASSDTSPVRSTGSSLPRPHIAPRFQGLDEHRSITSAWKGNSTKFVSRSGHLAYMIRFVLALRSDPSSSRVPLELPPSQERYPAFLLPLRPILGRLDRCPIQLRLNGVLGKFAPGSGRWHHACGGKG